jgi:signal transduction histidine kinase
MGGIIGFDTVEGRGSTFYFELPRSDSMSTTPLVEACSEE